MQYAVQDLKSPNIRLRELANVYSSWRNVIIDAAELWNVVQLGSPSAPVAVRRSKTRLIDIEMKYTDARSPQNVHNFLELIKPHASRWRSVYFEGSSAYLNVLAPLLSTTSSLKTLSLHSSSQLTLEEISRGGGLQSLSLSNIAVRGENMALQDLRSLSLQRMPGATPSFILGILKTCPAITHLSLDNHPPSFPAMLDNPSPRSSYTPLHLPNLVVLRFKAMSPNFVTSVVQSIRAEHLKTFIFDIGFDGDPRFFKCVLHEDGKTSSLPLSIIRHSSQSILRFNVWNDRVEVTLGEDEVGFTLRGCSAAVAVDHLRPFIILASEVIVHLHGAMKDCAWLDTIPQLTKLAVRDADATQAVIAYLSSPREAPEGTGLPCSKLIRFHSEEWWVRSAIRIFKAARSGETSLPRLEVTGGSLEGVGGKTDRPCAVRNLHAGPPF